MTRRNPTPDEVASARAEGRRMLECAAEHRRRAEAALSPGASRWENYTADELVKQARHVLGRIGEDIELPPPVQRRGVHLHDGGGVTACGVDVWPRIARDLSPAAASRPQFYVAMRLGTACAGCLQTETENNNTTEVQTHE